MGIYEKLREDMAYQTRSYLETSNPPSYNFLNNSFAGAGKSTITCTELENTDCSFVYLANQHRIGSEQILNNPALFDLVQIESRRRLCRSEDYIKLAGYGINIKHFCGECQYIGVCEYYQRITEIWAEPQSWVGVHHHLGGLVNSYVRENWIDAVVIDEYFLPAIFKRLTISYTNISRTINLVSKMTANREQQLVLDFLKEFALALKTGEVNNIYLYDQIFRYYKFGGSDFDLQLFSDEYEYRLAQFYFQKHKIFRNLVTPLFGAIMNINKHWIPMKDSNHLKYINNVIVPHITDKRRFVDISYYDLEALDLECKVLILDATTPAELYEKLFDRRIKTLKHRTILKSHIYQLKTAKYVMQTLDRSAKTKKRLLGIVSNIVDKHKEPVLTVSRKKYEAMIKNVDPTFITPDHYPLFGSNDYENYNVVILFGTPEPSHTELKRKATLLDYDEEKLLYLMREANMIQALNRIRPALKVEHDVDTYIYILSNVDLNLQNAVKLSIGKFERLLTDEINEYSTPQTVDRIKQDIINTLSYGDFPLSEIQDLVTGKNTLVSAVLQRLIAEGTVETYKFNSSGRGRKPTYCRLNEEFKNKID